MVNKYSKFDKGVIYTTGSLFLDLVVGGALTGKPLHTSLGLDSPEYVHTIESFATALGMSYILIKPLQRDRKKARLYNKIMEEKNKNLFGKKEFLNS